MKFKNWKIAEIAPIVEDEKITMNISDISKTALHTHRSFLEFAYVMQGRANHVINETPSIISKGDYFIIDYKTQHKYCQIGDTPFIVVNCLFVPQLIDQALINCQRFEEVVSNYLINVNFCQLKERPTNRIFHDSDGRIWKMVKRLCEEYEHKEIGYLESMRCQLILLLIDILRQLKLPNAEELNDESDIVNSIVNYVNNHFTESLSLKSFAAKHNYSSAHISNMFKHQTGMTFLEYVQSKRIQESCRLLANTNKSGADIANIVGYTDVKFFNKVFKRITGMTPKQFKQTFNMNKKDSNTNVEADDFTT